MDLEMMNALGITVQRPWVDHPYTNRGSYINAYNRANQYTNISGWSSQIAGGDGLPASHFGGAPPKTKQRKKKRERKERKKSDDPLRGSRERLPPGGQRLIIEGRDRSAYPERISADTINRLSSFGKNPTQAHVKRRSLTRSGTPERVKTVIPDRFRTRSRTPLGERLPEYKEREAKKLQAERDRMRRERERMQEEAEVEMTKARQEPLAARRKDRDRMWYKDIRRKLYLERMVDPDSFKAKFYESQIERGVREGRTEPRPGDARPPPGMDAAVKQKELRKDLSPVRRSPSPLREERVRSPRMEKRKEAALDAGHSVAALPPQLSNREIANQRMKNLKLDLKPTKPAARREAKRKEGSNLRKIRCRLQVPAERICMKSRMMEELLP